MPTLPELQAIKVEKIKAAAVAFANDYGPLPGANAGDEECRFEVGRRLVAALLRQGLKIV